MSNRFGIPDQVERRIRARDTRCVYCGKLFGADSRCNMPTIEHLNEKPPFYWRDGLRERGLAICCGSCNSSRGKRTLEEWFRTGYCTDRDIPIDGSTVAEPVRIYLRSRS
jgi:5-methylcytosine-specific restriction endonuclease McrA